MSSDILADLVSFAGARFEITLARISGDKKPRDNASVLREYDLEPNLGWPRPGPSV